MLRNDGVSLRMFVELTESTLLWPLRLRNVSLHMKSCVGMDHVIAAQQECVRNVEIAHGLDRRGLGRIWLARGRAKIWFRSHHCAPLTEVPP
jgi:hypothetical protein